MPSAGWLTPVHHYSNMMPSIWHTRAPGARRGVNPVCEALFKHDLSHRQKRFMLIFQAGGGYVTL